MKLCDSPNGWLDVVKLPVGVATGVGSEISGFLNTESKTRFLFVAKVAITMGILSDSKWFLHYFMYSVIRSVLIAEMEAV